MLLGEYRFIEIFSQLAAIESDHDLATYYFAKMEALVNTISNPEIKAECYLIIGYSFEKEITTMAPLYSNDVSRIKNMRLKILEALKNKNKEALKEELKTKPNNT